MVLLSNLANFEVADFNELGISRVLLEDAGQSHFLALPPITFASNPKTNKRSNEKNYLRSSKRRWRLSSPLQRRRPLLVSLLGAGPCGITMSHRFPLKSKATMGPSTSQPPAIHRVVDSPYLLPSSNSSRPLTIPRGAINPRSFLLQPSISKVAMDSFEAEDGCFGTSQVPLEDMDVFGTEDGEAQIQSQSQAIRNKQAYPLGDPNEKSKKKELKLKEQALTRLPLARPTPRWSFTLIGL